MHWHPARSPGHGASPCLSGPGSPDIQVSVGEGGDEQLTFVHIGALYTYTQAHIHIIYYIYTWARPAIQLSGLMAVSVVANNSRSCTFPMLAFRQLLGGSWSDLQNHRTSIHLDSCAIGDADTPGEGGIRICRRRVYTFSTQLTRGRSGAGTTGTWDT